ncbi:SirA-like protein [Caloramator mitchellensis]|uniref:SirA-like protein n=1 Tax=Caloramator mitchellensis TaxID=908809 RepID=A0A0R3JQW0_CALMK|nr:sulfurtransferase TusA family protein [Caloramator mitchellensis]KRQ85800.1 SirA-like protein [Caloramator mitchellensis]
MKDNIIDARGRACPEPVLLTKKGVEASPNGVKVLVDNVTARENIKRFAKNSGYEVKVEENGEGILLTLSR